MLYTKGRITMSKEIVIVNPLLPSILPIIPIEGTPVLPGLMASLQIPKGMAVQAVEKALVENQTVGLLLPKHKLQVLPAPKDSSDAPEVSYKLEDLYSRGISAKILKKILMTDGTMTLLVHGMQRFEVENIVQSTPSLSASVHYFAESAGKDIEVEALARSVIMQVKQLSESNPFFSEEMKIAMINTPSKSSLADLVAFAIGLRGKDAQSFIETVDVRERFLKLLVLLRKEQDLASLQKKLSSEVENRVNKIQREFFLKEQMKSIKKELGQEDDDKSRETKTLKEKILAAKLPAHALKIAEEELHRLQTIPETSPEFNLSRNYIDWIASLPWSKSTKDNLDLKRAREVLDKGHYGLEKVKDRILEFLAVRKLKPGFEGTILCLVGPPGVGKTSLGKSIAECLEREFFRFSLGGMRDEAEIKGHRRTYIGAMSGKVLQGIKRAGSNNPVIMLDEIDKVGMSYQGDPASALLEVLDPEQNNSFLDHYLDIAFDLSKVIFIATANNLGTIPPALLDRMEVIELPGYTPEEKEKIAFNYVIPKALEKHGLAKSSLEISKGTLRKIISDYAREPGVRTLQQQLDKIARRTARIQVEKNKRTKTVIQEKKLDDWLGPQRFYNEMAERVQQPGVVTGLAWTSAGGDILFIEAIALEGKGELKLTGQMGEVMQESAKIASSLVRKYLSQKKGVMLQSLVKDPKTGKTKLVKPTEWFSTHDIHLHIPAGAVPKDGPSAGITMASALLSVATGRIAKHKVAMTGELSLIGKVLPVGGIKEKVLAAKRSGITHIVLPKLNKNDLKEIPLAQKQGLALSYATKITEVFDKVLQE